MTRNTRAGLVPLSGIVLVALLVGCPLPPGGDNGGDDLPDDGDANRPPVAVAGDDRTVVSGESVTLDATGSSDSNGDRLLFFWRQESGAELDVASAFSSIARFTAPTVTAETVFVFHLVVTDGFYAASDDVQITVAPN